MNVLLDGLSVGTSGSGEAVARDVRGGKGDGQGGFSGSRCWRGRGCLLEASWASLRAVEGLWPPQDSGRGRLGLGTP